MVHMSFNAIYVRAGRAGTSTQVLYTLNVKCLDAKVVYEKYSGII